MLVNGGWPLKNWVTIFQNVILFWILVHIEMWYFCEQLVQYNAYLVSIVDTDDLVFY